MRPSGLGACRIPACHPRQPSHPAAAHHNHSILTEQPGEAENTLGRHQNEKMRLCPSRRTAAGREYGPATQPPPQRPLHAIVPAARHAAGMRVPGGDEHASHGMVTAKQCIHRRAPASDAHTDASGGISGRVGRAPIGCQQGRRNRFSRCVRHRTPRPGGHAPTSVSRTRAVR